MPIGFTQQRELTVFYWSIDDYIQRAGPTLLQIAFFEEEINRIIELFDPLAHF